jgi:hypothetical protein
MNETTRAAFEEHIQRKRAEYVERMREARRMDAEQPTVAHPYDYLLAMDSWLEYTRAEAFVDLHTGEFTRRPTARIPRP